MLLVQQYGLLHVTATAAAAASAAAV